MISTRRVSAANPFAGIPTPPAAREGRWVVWSKQGEGFAPEGQRYTYQSDAERRATQLAQANPGHSFFVAILHSTHVLPNTGVNVTRFEPFTI